MSWWVYLHDQEGNTLEVPSHAEGGTIVLGGTPTAELNVTYNYGKLFREYLHSDGLEWLNGKKAKDTVSGLIGAIQGLGGDKPDNNYWDPTPGNAAHALSTLLKWALIHPEGVWEIS